MRSVTTHVREFPGAVRSAFGVLAGTNRPTLDALRKVAHASHEAGWPQAVTAEELDRPRTEAGRLPRPDDLKVIQAVAAEFNRSPDDLARQRAQALADLAAFAREADLGPA